MHHIFGGRVTEHRQPVDVPIEGDVPIAGETNPGGHGVDREEDVDKEEDATKKKPATKQKAAMMKKPVTEKIRPPTSLQNIEGTVTHNINERAQVTTTFDEKLKNEFTGEEFDILDV